MKQSEKKTIPLPLYVPVYRSLFRSLGASGWWPAESPFEVIVGAILTQNTSWKNVEKGIASLKEAGILEPSRMAATEEKQLAEMIRSTGYFNQKAIKLKSFLAWFDLYGYSVDRIKKRFSTKQGELRKQLLEVHGIGPETADSILCYALDFPVFVVDAYSLRWVGRYRSGLIELKYQGMQSQVMDEFARFYPPEEINTHYNEYHALMVRLGNTICKKNKPQCQVCPLDDTCEKNHG